MTVALEIPLNDLDHDPFRQVSPELGSSFLQTVCLQQLASAGITMECVESFFDRLLASQLKRQCHKILGAGDSLICLALLKRGGKGSARDLASMCAIPSRAIALSIGSHLVPQYVESEVLVSRGTRQFTLHRLPPLLIRWLKTHHNQPPVRSLINLPICAVDLSTVNKASAKVVFEEFLTRRDTRNERCQQSRGRLYRTIVFLGLVLLGGVASAKDLSHLTELKTRTIGIIAKGDRMLPYIERVEVKREGKLAIVYSLLSLPDHVKFMLNGSRSSLPEMVLTA